MSMRLFALYISDEQKEKLVSKLKTLNLDTEKGAISATIRTLIDHFLSLSDGTSQELAGLIRENYTLTTKKNKRSKL